jgi:hypothetical protein
MCEPVPNGVAPGLPSGLYRAANIDVADDEQHWPRFMVPLESFTQRVFHCSANSAKQHHFVRFSAFALATGGSGEVEAQVVDEPEV